MKQIKDLTGLRVNKCVVIRFTGRFSKSRNAIWELRCDCGGIRIANSGAIKSGGVVSCGCSLKTQFGCSIEGCENKAHARHLCWKHLHRDKKPSKTSFDPAERLIMRSKKMPSGCIEWTGQTGNFGYGQTSYKGKTFNVHRLAWILKYGEIENGLFVCHKCDNPRCINLEHLFLGTAKDNIHDAISKGRMVWQKTR